MTSEEPLPPPPPTGDTLPARPERLTFPARPQRLPEPTYWPLFTAAGIAFIGWGLISTWIIAICGLLVFIVSLVGWINILRHEGE
ncbi:MAG TPA: hypothetical protein VL978_07190 [Puia sp.]|nr:hypothetical protein [Puia sp.]